MFNITKCANAEEWLKARQKGIGGSDASCVVGLNPYKTNQELWREKTGRVVPEDISGKPCIIFGKNAEEHIRELFKLEFPEYNVEHSEYDVYSNSAHPFLQASLDGVITTRDGSRGILEIKTSDLFGSMAMEKWTDKIPDNYYAQCLHYLIVTGYEFVILKARLSSTYQGEKRASIKHYFINASDQAVKDDMAWLQAKEVAFWQENILKDIEPNLILPSI